MFRRFASPFIAITILAVMTCFGCSSVPKVSDQKIAVPAYFYPGTVISGKDLWKQINTAAPTLGLVVINPGIYILGNPDCDTWEDTNYSAQVTSTQNKEILVLGYVPAKGPVEALIASVIAQIDLFLCEFNVDGIFIDEVSLDCGLVFNDDGSPGYYRQIFDYVKYKSSQGSPSRELIVAMNPGTQSEAAECFMSASDILVNFEGFFEQPSQGDPGQWYKGNYLAPSWVSEYPANRFWHIIHTANTVEKMQAAVKLSKDRNAGWVYVTDDDPYPYDSVESAYTGNPYDSLPPESASNAYWPLELAEVASGIKSYSGSNFSAFDLFGWWPGDGSPANVIGADHAQVHLNPGSPYSPYSVGKIGKSFSLGAGGYEDYLSLGTGPAIKGDQAFAIDVWIATTDSEGVIIQQRDLSEGGDSGEYILSVGGISGQSVFAHKEGEVCWSMFGPTASAPGNDQWGLNFCTGSKINDGIFHHIAAVREATGAGFIYVDGKLAGQETNKPSIILKPHEVFVGADKRDNGLFFTGLIDEIRIHNQPLSAAQVGTLNKGGIHKRRRHALWVWPKHASTIDNEIQPADEVNVITQDSERTELVERAAASGVGALFVSVYHYPENTAQARMYERDDIAPLIKMAHEQTIEVWASYGEKNWHNLGCNPNSSPRPFPSERMQEIVDYNLAYPNARFDGVALDVEIPKNSDNAEFQNLLQLYHCVQETLRPHGIKIAAAVNWELDKQILYPNEGGAVKKFHEHVIELNLDAMVVMGYAQDAATIIDRIKDEVLYANDVKKDLILSGIETKNCDIGANCLPSATFFELGQDVMNGEAWCVYDIFHSPRNPGFAGFAMHAYGDSYLIKQANWPANNSWYPGGYEEKCVNTHVGNPSTVRAIEFVTGASPIKIEFAEVTKSGATFSLALEDPPNSLVPPGLTLGSPPTVFLTSTTATFSGPLKLCIDFGYNNVAYSTSDLADLKLYYREDSNTTWMEVDASVDTSKEKICSKLSSLGLFAIVEP